MWRLADGVANTAKGAEALLVGSIQSAQPNLEASCRRRRRNGARGSGEGDGSSLRKSDRVRPRFLARRASAPFGHAAVAPYARAARWRTFALDRLFPGLETDLMGAGAVRIRLRRDMRLELPGFDSFPQRDLGYDQFALSRPALERVCRYRLEQEPSIEIPRASPR
jgi:hypothetical protein